MNKKQIAVLQRIIRRETAAWNLRPDRPHPGLHPSGEKFVVTDGEICVLLSSPVDGIPEGDRVDSLADITERELHLGTHLRLPNETIAPQFWRSLKHTRRPIREPNLELSVSDEAGQKAAARFKVQLLLDAVGAVGANPRMDLGYGRFTNNPTLLVRQAGWASKGGVGPVALVLPMKEGAVQKGGLFIGTDD